MLIYPFFRINAKVGGVNFCPIDPSFEQCKSAPMMIVGRCSHFHCTRIRLSPWVIGADVGHASPGVQRPSLASVVFSMDNTFSRYQALARLQQGRVEAIADLKEMMVVGVGWQQSVVPCRSFSPFRMRSGSSTERMVAHPSASSFSGTGCQRASFRESGMLRFKPSMVGRLGPFCTRSLIHLVQMRSRRLGES